jgi:hypothetical protein
LRGDEQVDIDFGNSFEWFKRGKNAYARQVTGRDGRGGQRQMAATVTARIIVVISGMFVGGGRWTLVCWCAICYGVLRAAGGFPGELSGMGFPTEIDCGKGEDYGNQGEGKKLSIKIFDKHQPSTNCAGFLLGLDYKSIRLFVSNGLFCMGFFYCLVR